jgi:NAD(P)H-hydrate epimerase
MSGPGAEADLPRPAPELRPDAHKGDAGRVTCIAGSESMPGAAVLVARAAQRAGAGLVTLGCLDSLLLGVVPAAAPEAVLLDLGELGSRGGRATEEAARLLNARDPHAVLFGPGVGDDARARAVLELVLDEARVFPGRPLVLDADALNALEGRPERLRERAAPLVLTPHPGEAARLLGRAVPGAAEERARAARELTVVADGERLRVNRTGNPGMATAGTGDVLAGVLVALAAASVAAAESGADGGFGLWDAVVLAVHVHGLAGDLAAAERGARSVIASDLVRCLPQAFRRLERARGSEPGE